MCAQNVHTMLVQISAVYSTNFRRGNTVHEYPDSLVPVLLASLLQVLGQLAHMQSALQLRHRRRIVECAHQFHVAW